MPYTDEDIDLLLQVRNHFCEALDSKATDTLVTKIMLGVFGNVPAFDSRFKTGFGISHFREGAFNETCLKRVTEFYKRNRGEIDGYPPIYTFDFYKGTDTKRRYTKAKLVDMVGWVEGSRNSPA